MSELLSAHFFQLALVAALCTGLAAPVIGTYLVQRRMALMGDGIGHLAVTGVALGLLTNASPTWTAVVVTIAGATLIEVIRERGHTNGDVALALLFYGGIAGGVLITGLADQSAASLQSYLFGSIISIDSGDATTTALLAVVVIGIGVGLLPQLFAVCQDAEFAQVAGLPVRAYNLLIGVMAAVTVTVSMRTVGLLLVSALMVVPVATSQQLTSTFRHTLVLAMGLGATAAVGGLLVSGWLSTSFEASVAPGPAIVLLSLCGFVLTWPLGIWRRRRRRLRAPFPATEPVAHDVADEHGHQHGPDCGHPAIEHGDHVDYVHDGHRHAVHEDGHGQHYDEH